MLVVAKYFAVTLCCRWWSTVPLLEGWSTIKPHQTFISGGIPNRCGGWTLGAKRMLPLLLLPWCMPLRLWAQPFTQVNTNNGHIERQPGRVCVSLSTLWPAAVSFLWFSTGPAQNDPSAQELEKKRRYCSFERSRTAAVDCLFFWGGDFMYLLCGLYIC